MSGSDKRRAARIPVALPIRVNQTGLLNSSVAKTKDFSSNGMSFEFDSSLGTGSEIVFNLTLPEDITHGNPVRIKCKGKVVRVSRGGEQSEGISLAVNIERYEEFFGNSAE